MEQTDLLEAADEDSRALLAAAQVGWDRPVPHCPGWDVAELVRHTGGIHYWVAAIVTTGERVTRRTLAPGPPEDIDSLPAWYLAGVSRALEVLGSADPDTPTWTFSRTGEHRAGWWCRRLAVEVAVHRWDAERALIDEGLEGTGPQSMQGDVAAVGVEEFVTEFLPGLLAREGVEGLNGRLHLVAIDGPTEWSIDLGDAGKVIPDKGAEADTTIRGTRSDLLLWVNNRGPLETIEVTGDEKILDRWGQLTF